MSIWSVQPSYGTFSGAITHLILRDKEESNPKTTWNQEIVPRVMGVFFIFASLLDSIVLLILAPLDILCCKKIDVLPNLLISLSLFITSISRIARNNFPKVNYTNSLANFHVLVKDGVSPYIIKLVETHKEYIRTTRGIYCATLQADLKLEVEKKLKKAKDNVHLQNLLTVLSSSL